MKTMSRLAMAMSLIFAAPVFADDAHHPEAAPAAPAAPATVTKMQGNVKEMQAQLDRVSKAKTDEERQQAMAEHMQTMMENMQLARGMPAGKMDCSTMHGGMKMGHAGAPDQAASDRLQQLEKRMEMMERMMAPHDAGAATPTK